MQGWISITTLTILTSRISALFKIGNEVMNIVMLDTRYCGIYLTIVGTREVDSVVKVDSLSCVVFFKCLTSLIVMSDTSLISLFMFGRSSEVAISQSIVSPIVVTISNRVVSSSDTLFVSHVAVAM